MIPDNQVGQMRRKWGEKCLAEDKASEKASERACRNSWLCCRAQG